MPALTSEVTQLLINWSKGDKAALDELIPLVEAELRRLASWHVRATANGSPQRQNAFVIIDNLGRSPRCGMADRTH
jgi:hypothetical protein